MLPVCLIARGPASNERHASAKQFSEYSETVVCVMDDHPFKTKINIWLSLTDTDPVLVHGIFAPAIRRCE